MRRSLASLGALLPPLLLLLLLLLVAGAEPAVAQSASQGALHVVWGDPEEGMTGRRPDARPLHRFFVDRPGLPSQEVSFGTGAVATIDGTSPVLLGGRQVRLDLGPALGSGSLAPVRGAVLSDGLGAGPSVDGARLSRAAAAGPLLRPVAIILCQFPDSTIATWKSAAQYQHEWTGGAPSIDAYYTEVSRGAVSIEGTRSFGPYRLPKARTEYVQNNSADLTRLLTDCTGAADADVRFPDYWGVVMYFSAPLDCCSWGGSRSLTLDGQTRTYGVNWNASWAQLSTSIHEFGHSLGLPHSSSAYGRVYDSAWDVMSASASTTHFVAWGKQRLGYVAAPRVVVARGDAQVVRVGRSAQPLDDGSALAVEIPLPTGPGHAYIVEARRSVGLDARIPGDGVVITRVDPRRGEPAHVLDGDGNGNVNDAGAIWSPGERYYDDRFGIEIVVREADATGFTVVVRNNAFGGIAFDGAPRTDTLAAGATATRMDSVRVRLAPGTSGWVAQARAGWLQLLASSGAADGTLRWRTSARGLPVGTHVDTIRVSAVGSTTETVLPVALHVAGSAPALGVLGRWSADTAYAGIGFNVLDSMRVVPDDAARAWTVTAGGGAAPHLNVFQRVPGTGGGFSYRFVTSLGGAGTGWVFFARAPRPGLAAGTINVDSLVVVSGAARLAVVDTLRIATAPTLTLARWSAPRPLLQGGADRDSLRVRASGAQGPVRWIASATGRAIRVDASAISYGGLGDGVVRLTRRAGTLAPGTYVDTVSVWPQGRFTLQTRFVDTTHVDAAAELTVTGWPLVRSAVVARGAEQSLDSVFVSINGPDAATRVWKFRSARGMATEVARGAPTPERGSGWLRWSRAVGGLADRLHVDTIFVTVDGATNGALAVVDSVTVEFPLVLSAPLRTGAETVAALSPERADSLAVRLEGRGALETAWRASARAPWLRVTTGSGVGPGVVHFTRRTDGLPPGLHTDTIAVLVGSAAAPSVRWLVVDTVRVLATPTVDAAARDLLRVTFMTETERRALDDAGNRDGTFNLGDVMAHADRMRTPLSADVMAELLGRAASAPTAPDAKGAAPRAAPIPSITPRSPTPEAPRVP